MQVAGGADAAEYYIHVGLLCAMVVILSSKNFFPSSRRIFLSSYGSMFFPFRRGRGMFVRRVLAEAAMLAGGRSVCPPSACGHKSRKNRRCMKIFRHFFWQCEFLP